MQTWTLKLRHALYAAEKVFFSFKMEDYDRAEAKVRELVSSDAHASSVLGLPDSQLVGVQETGDGDGEGEGGALVNLDADIDVEAFLTLVVNEWGKEEERREKYVVDLFTAGDVDGDGKFTSSEFAASIKHINNAFDETACMRMYREASHLCKGDSLDAAAYSDTCTKFGLLDKWWIPGGNIFSSVNTLHALENTWRKTRYQQYSICFQIFHSHLVEGQ